MESYIHTIQYYETDKMGIVHHSNYIRWMEEARLDLLGQLGCSYAALEESGIISPVVSVSCAYRKPTTFGEIISITVTVKEFRGVKLIFGYTMKNALGEAVCEAESSHCFTNAEGRPINLKHARPEVYEKIAAAVEASGPDQK